MPLNFGDLGPTAIYVGGQAVSKVYVGSTQVWPGGGGGEPVTVDFPYTGSAQSWVVPAGVTSIDVVLDGAAGGGDPDLERGGKGGRVETTLAVTPGETLGIYVGGAGVACTSSAVAEGGGWNGGGHGGPGDRASRRGHGGGGASDVRRGGSSLAHRAAVAGGGGGAGSPSGLAGQAGGHGGYPAGDVGAGGTLGSPGEGGTQTAGGDPGGNAGALGVGGNAHDAIFGSSNRGAGGGGAGFYGGSSSQTVSSGFTRGGGGGSSASMGTATTYTDGHNDGNGHISITYTP